jgi:hypothetical protein
VRALPAQRREWRRQGWRVHLVLKGGGGDTCRSSISTPPCGVGPLAALRRRCSPPSAPRLHGPTR